MTTMAFIVFAAALALGVAMRTRLPASVLAILGGVLLQLLPAPIDGEIVRDGLLIAATFLVFAVGAEIERRPLRPYRAAALGITALTLLVTAAAGVALWLVLGIDRLTAIYLVLSLGASSTLLVFEVLRRRERFFEPLGRAVVSAALMQDVVVIVALCGLATLGRDWSDRLMVLGGGAGLGTLAWLLAHQLAPFIMLRLRLDDEERLLFVLLILSSFAASARLFGVPLVAGVFLAGLAVSVFPVGGLVRGYLKSFSDFFTTIFYVMLGLIVAVSSIRAVLLEATFVAAVLLARPFVLMPLMRSTGLTVRASLEAVMLLAQAGELAIIVALVGVDLGHIDEGTLSVVAVVVVVTTALAPWLSSSRVTWWLTHRYPFGDRVVAIAPRTGHIVLLGCGETGTVLLRELRARGQEVVVVDDDPAVVASLRRQGIPALRGDAASPGLLTRAHADQASAMVSTMRRHDDNARLLSIARGPRVLVRVFSEAEAEAIRALGGHPIADAEIAATAILAWYATLAVDPRRAA